MNEKNVTFRTSTFSERAVIADFLWSMRDEFHFTEQSVIEEIVTLLFEKGGVIGGYVDDVMVGMLGYFHGEPSKQYRNQDVGFIYVAGIAKTYRRSGAIIRGAHLLSKTLQTAGVRQVRCHAAEGNVYNNRLYARIATPIGREANRRGDMCTLYASSVENMLALTAPRHKGQALRIH